jgi:hypothetical protein
MYKAVIYRYNSEIKTFFVTCFFNNVHFTFNSIFYVIMSCHVFCFRESFAVSFFVLRNSVLKIIC